MAIKLEINLTNSWLYAISFVFIVIVSVTGVWAYNTNFNQGNPSEMGHSSGEINVNIGGTVKPLQQAINDGDLGGSGGGLTVTDMITGVWVPANNNGNWEIEKIADGSYEFCYMRGANGYGSCEEAYIYNQADGWYVRGKGCSWEGYLYWACVK